MGSFDTKINNVRISNTWINSVWIIVAKCLVHYFPAHLVFGLKLYKFFFSSYTLPLLSN